MRKVKIIEVHENVFADNVRTADETRRMLDSCGTVMFNVMSSPGSGKTTTISAVINQLKDKYKIAVLDVDIKSDLDATTIAKNTGVKSIQIHNGGLCHIDADMTARSLQNIKPQDYDIIFLENIGNLVCPAEFDTGAHKNIMLLSIPEGDDKPLKYPLMFSVADIVVFSKIDTKPIFDFDIKKCKDYIIKLNPNVEFFGVSARNGDGMDKLAKRLEQELKTKER